MKSKFSNKWKEAVESEFETLNENKTWTICDLPKGKKAIKTMWVFKIKEDSNNKSERFKARLVVKRKRKIILKRILKYSEATKDNKLVYKKSKKKEIELSCFKDSDYAGSLEDRKSTSGYLFKYGMCVISWNSSKQKTISLSSTEAEYIGLATAAKEALWLKHILIELDRNPGKTIIYCDNQSTICLSLNPEMHARSKHIDIRHHFIREKIENQEFEVKYQASEEMVADILTKGLPRIKHYKCMEIMELKN